MRLFLISVVFILSIVVTTSNAATCDDELCCHVQQMSRQCLSKGGAANVKDNQQSPDIDILKREIAMLKDMLTWYKARNGKLYKVFNEWVNYTTAVERCIDEGAQLVTDGIRNTETRSELECLIKAAGENTWIGLNDLNNEGEWRWIDNVAADMALISWDNYQPDNHKGGEDCGHYWKKVGWYVNDAQCSDDMYFICEKTINAI